MRVRACHWSAAVLLGLAALPSLGAAAAPKPADDAPDKSAAADPGESPRHLKDEQQTTKGSVTVAGHALSYQAEAGKTSESAATFGRAIEAAQRQLGAAPRSALALRTLAHAYLYAGRGAAAAGDRSGARTDFDEVVRLATRLPGKDDRHDMYLEEAQEAIVALGLSAPNGLSVSLAPWTGADLPGSIASTFKYRLAVAGDAGRNVSLVAAEVPKHWIASFCSDNACAPSRTSFALPPSGVKVVEFQLVPPGGRAPVPKVRVTGSDGRNEASATT